MSRYTVFVFFWLAAAALAQPITDSTALRINQIQFVGSHNSYKKAMSSEAMVALKASNPNAAKSLDYGHLPLAEQLDLGMRVLELDVFYDRRTQSFPVGHVQVIDMNSQCPNLTVCLGQIRDWSDANSQHIPIWVMFNAKDQAISGLPDPEPFTAVALRNMDRVLLDVMADRIISPAQVQGLNWPTVATARGKVLFLFDESGQKRDWYADGSDRPMFPNVAADHPQAAIMVMNDPIAQQTQIQQLVAAGYMVRTRADADTVEARVNDPRRAAAGFASGAQAISTDYYLPATHFGSDYRVHLPNVVQCNPVTAPVNCAVTE